MRIIDSTSAMYHALDSPLDDGLRQLLTLWRDRLHEYQDYDLGELACLIVVEPHDNVAQIEAEAGVPLITEAAFESVSERNSWFEGVRVISDDGYGVVLLVPARADVDPLILSTMRKVVMMGSGDGQQT